MKEMLLSADAYNVTECHSTAGTWQENANLVKHRRDPVYHLSLDTSNND